MIAVGYLHQPKASSLTYMSSQSDEEIQKTLANNGKLKNQLCRNYLETGYCKYHRKCQFAHGIKELRQHQQANNKYKTKKCISYFEKACCSYGERCNFRHFHQSQDEEQTWRKAKVNFREVFWHVRNRNMLFSLSG